MSEVKTIKYQAIQYGKSYQQCLDILKFIKEHSPDTKFELISGASDYDRLEAENKLLKAKLEKARDLYVIKVGWDDCAEKDVRETLEYDKELEEIK